MTPAQILHAQHMVEEWRKSIQRREAVPCDSDPIRPEWLVGGELRFQNALVEEGRRWRSTLGAPTLGSGGMARLL